MKHINTPSSSRKFKRSIISAALITITSSFILPLNAIADDGMAKYNSKNELIRPSGFREWIYVGTPLTPNDMNNGKAAFPEFHNVYISPDSWKHWKKTGKFKDGTVIIKELVSVGSKSAASGKGYFMGEYLGLEALIKDSKRFSKEVGNWAFFSFSSPDHKTLASSAKAQPEASCSTCHQANANDDLVFTKYYPVLRAGKATGEKATGGVDSKL
ncbi:MAG: cytochrome P460 [endosymbiont of Galathealinum brachiosum]|uniref:Cytochrome P460 n=1 Tax=endosymbiont of Galathealinum brachiosum TaxID=2200906 RepID=A0A370DLW5_9GAMM|nr:MAG: cytochrome P460 [endosymbiont of Galathealinum brachiosum]